MPDRVPSLGELKEIADALSEYFQRVNGSFADNPRAQEKHVYPWLVRLADALRPVSLEPSSFSGWPNRVRNGVALATHVLDQMAHDWGCEGLTQPEPLRSAHRERRSVLFHETYERPIIRAAIAWQAFNEGLDCPQHVQVIADKGLEDGETAPVPPEEGKSAYLEAVRNRDQACCLWDKFPLPPDFALTPADIETKKDRHRRLSHAHGLIESAVAEVERAEKTARMTSAAGEADLASFPESVAAPGKFPICADMVAFNQDWAARLRASIDRLKAQLLDAIDHSTRVATQSRIDEYRRQIELGVTTAVQRSLAGAGG